MVLNSYFTKRNENGKIGSVNCMISRMMIFRFEFVSVW